jgi:hypothetical protein
LQWAERYYANERELALKMIKELDEAEAAFPRAADGGMKIPWPAPEFWYEIERKADADD